MSAKRENLTEIVEQAKVLDEKIQEARQLESMYERELESNQNDK